MSTRKQATVRLYLLLSIHHRRRHHYGLLMTTTGGRKQSRHRNYRYHTCFFNCVPSL